MKDSNPIGKRWEDQFQAKSGREPVDVDRQDRLFSLIFAGSSSGCAWSEQDWECYQSNREGFWSGSEVWPVDDLAKGYNRFEMHLRRLSSHYGSGQEFASYFARAAGLIWGGIAYEGPLFTALFKAGVGDHLLQLGEGADGWREAYVDDDNPAHHWVAAFVAGYGYGTLMGVLTNSVRDVAQMLTG